MLENDKHYSQYIPFVEIPPEVHSAAETLFMFFEKAGMREWQFSHVADRRLVVNLERQVEHLHNQIYAANSDMNIRVWRKMTPEEYAEQYASFGQHVAISQEIVQDCQEVWVFLSASEEINNMKEEK